MIDLILLFCMISFPSPSINVVTSQCIYMDRTKSHVMSVCCNLITLATVGRFVLDAKSGQAFLAESAETGD